MTSKSKQIANMAASIYPGVVSSIIATGKSTGTVIETTAGIMADKALAIAAYLYEQAEKIDAPTNNQ